MREPQMPPFLNASGNANEPAPTTALKMLKNTWIGLNTRIQIQMNKSNEKHTIASSLGQQPDDRLSLVAHHRHRYDEKKKKKKKKKRAMERERSQSNW
jgi:hypothetical protein